MNRVTSSDSDHLSVMDGRWREEGEHLYPTINEIDAIPMPECDQIFASVPRSTAQSFDDKKIALIAAMENLAVKTPPSRGESDRPITADTRSNQQTTRRQDEYDTRQQTHTTTPYRASKSVQDSLYHRDSKRRNRNSPGRSPGSVSVDSPAHIPLDFQESKKSGSKLVSPQAEIEISPGVFLPLHGSQETLEAMTNDALVACACFCCSADLYCVRTADYVLCPTCRVISPISDDSCDAAAGVGLGLTAREYHAWQREQRASRNEPLRVRY